MAVPKYKEEKAEEPALMVSKVSDLKKLASGDVLVRYGKDGKLVDAYHVKGKDDEGRYAVGIWDKKTGKYIYKSDNLGSMGYYAQISPDGKSMQIMDNRRARKDLEAGKPLKADEVYVQMGGGKKAEAPEEKKPAVAKQAAPAKKVETPAEEEARKPPFVGGGKKVFNKTDLEGDAEYYSNYVRNLNEDGVAGGGAKLRYGAGFRKQDLISELSEGERQWLSENLEDAADALKEIIADRGKGAGEAGFRAFREWIKEKAGAEPAEKEEDEEPEEAEKGKKEAPAKEEKKAPTAEKAAEKPKAEEAPKEKTERKEEKAEEKKAEETAKAKIEEQKVEARKPVLKNREIHTPEGDMTIKDYEEKQAQKIKEATYNDDSLVVRERDRGFSVWDLLVVPAVWKYGLSYVTDAVGLTEAPVKADKRDAEFNRRVEEFHKTVYAETLRLNGIGMAEDGSLYELEVAGGEAEKRKAPAEGSRADEVIE